MLVRGALRAFDAATYTATVEVIGSRGYNLSGVPVSRGIVAVEMIVGRTVFLLVADATNPRDAMVVGVY
jgi:hypothetical protein